MMTCAEFLERYTEFRDGLLTATNDVRRFQRHLAQCPACRRYDAVLRRGVLELKATETVEISPDFRHRLERRLAREGASAGPRLAARAGLTAALFVAVAIALVALEWTHRPTTEVAPALPRVPFPKPVAQAGLPFVSFQDPRASVVISNPNPYGTSLVEPAATGR
jgi:anti-sigma factor RsiW